MEEKIRELEKKSSWTWGESSKSATFNKIRYH